MEPDSTPKKDFHVEQLVQEHGKDISGLSEKLLKCYSSERYEDFQIAVNKIILDVIGSEEGRIKIKAHATEATKEYKGERNWSKLTFWLPTVIAALLLAVTLFAIYHHEN